MDTAALLEKFQSRVKEIERLQELIHKAKSQSSRFSRAVVEKVVKDNTAKILDITQKLAPVVAEVSSTISTLKGKRDGVMVGTQEAKFTLQELELRHLIGEYDESEYAELSAAPRETVEQADSQVAALEGQVGALEGAMSQWSSIADKIGITA